LNACIAKCTSKSITTLKIITNKSLLHTSIMSMVTHCTHRSNNSAPAPVPEEEYVYKPKGEADSDSEESSGSENKAKSDSDSEESSESESEAEPETDFRTVARELGIEIPDFDESQDYSNVELDTLVQSTGGAFYKVTWRMNKLDLIQAGLSRMMRGIVAKQRDVASARASSEA
jgi:hypothetical protein